MRFKLLHAVLTVLILLVLTSFSYAEKIELKNNFFTGWKYSLDGGMSYQKVGNSGNELYRIMEGNEAAQGHLKTFKSHKTVATIFAIPGGFLVGWPIGGGLAGEWKDSYNTMLIIGIPLSIVSLIFESTASSHLKKGVGIYNGEEQTINLKPVFNFAQSGNKENVGFALVYSF